MNDRFKFRIWHKPSKQMYYNDFILSPTGHLTPMFNQCDLDFDKQCKVMQSTGLKDKNGKLIYEGDIVKQGDAKYVVNWLEGTFCFKGLKTLHNFSIEYVMPSKQEVIGNIYENKELLECQK